MFLKCLPILVSFGNVSNKVEPERFIEKKRMAAKDKSTPKENIQQQPDKSKDDSRPETPKPPQKKDPNAEPTSDKEEDKK